jgi:hypothetical protein
MKKSLAGLAAVSVMAVALGSCGKTLDKPTAKAESGYQAVFLDSGAVFFGKMEGLGTDYPVLKNVFYVQSVTNPETKQTNNILVKRGKEWHGPDKMTINAHHIIFVEPVTDGSQVATLIAQAK